MRPFIIAALCGSIACTCAYAIEPGAHEVVALGSTKCAVWTSWGERKEDSYKTLRFIAVNWMQGFATGVSYAFEATRKIQLHMPESITDADSVTTWMDHYCGAHPEKSFDAAGQQFISDLWEKSK